jgi:hypothetical protein
MKIYVVSIAVLVINGLAISEGFSTTTGGQNLTPTLTFLKIGRQQLCRSGSIFSLRVSVTVEDETKSDFGSAMPAAEVVDPHDIIGVEPEKLALGINPDEFLEWVGT